MCRAAPRQCSLLSGAITQTAGAPAAGATGQQETKAAAALQETSQPARDHHEHSTWHADDASQPAEPAWSSKTLWALFALGWIIAPCWWAGVAAGLTTGPDSRCLLRRRRGLKPAQVAAWYAHITMTIVSAVLVILVCSIVLTRPHASALCADLAFQLQR